MRIFRCLLTWPVPLHSLHGESTMFPVPLHLPQVSTRMNLAKPAFCIFWTWPVPPHWAHLLGVVPGDAPLPLQMPQSSVLGISISFVTSFTTSSRPSCR